MSETPRDWIDRFDILTAASWLLVLFTATITAGWAFAGFTAPHLRVPAAVFTVAFALVTAFSAIGAIKMGRDNRI